jgi:F-type H+-transporting ATPase subunit b
MEHIMDVNPGLAIWTLINFGIFLFLILKFGTKPIMNGLNARQERIRTDIESAKNSRDEAEKFKNELEASKDSAIKEMTAIIAKGKEQAEILIRKATEEADRVKLQKVEEATREIDRSKDLAIKELRHEVASLVVMATEKILDETLDKEKHYKLVESYIDKLPNN